MKIVIALLATICYAPAGQAVTQDPNDDARFVAIDIFLDSAKPVAAWQFALDELNGAMQVVGVENGSSPAFSSAPYFDREAVAQGRADRIIVADFSLAPQDALPVGRIRIATVHVRLSGAADPDFRLDLVTAAAADGNPVNASISMEHGR